MENLLQISPEELPFLLISLLWTLPWKGVALWKAVKRSEMKWFIALLILNTLAIIEIFYIFVWCRRQTKPDLGATAKTPASNAASDEDKKNKEKLLEAIKEWGRITLETGQSIIEAPEGVVFHYLEELRREGRVRRLVNRSGEVVYRPR